MVKTKIIFILTVFLGLTFTTLYAQEGNRQPSTNNNVQEGTLFYHTIEQGQTVYSIAKMYGVSEDDIYRHNPGSKDVIKVGQRLQIPQKAAASTVTASQEDSNYTFHNIQPKETLFSLSQKYNVPATALVEANPGLSVTTFQIGKIIRIPAATAETAPPKEAQTVIQDIEYKVEKRETMFRITRKFNITQDELIAKNPQLKNGVKEGMILKIPVKVEDNSAATASKNLAAKEKDANALLTTPMKISLVDTLKIVLLLPFMVDNATPSSNNSRYIEYYEGFLLALDSLQNKGVSVKLTVRDIGVGVKKLNEILNEPALKEANLIIGAVENDQITPTATFAKNNKIKYVIPFASRNDDVLTNAYVFQVNTPHSYLYAKAAQTACEMFHDANIIFVDTHDADDKAEFIRLLKQELGLRNAAYKDITYKEDTFSVDIEKLLRTDKRNIVIPTSGSMEALAKVKPALRLLVEQKPEIPINLFGYPEWQTYARENLEDFFLLNTYIYSNFYADNVSNDISRFYAMYKIWFSKNPTNTFPKYSMLGFDTGMFFIEALSKYGKNFESNLDKIKYKSLQMGFHFQRVNNWGGFINTNLFIVHYDKASFKVVRQEVKQ
ncbi:peptidase M23 [Bacteroidia bacterium]|nr:peptidase M23 [Bacteroidia bacterium]